MVHRNVRHYYSISLLVSVSVQFRSLWLRAHFILLLGARVYSQTEHQKPAFHIVQNSYEEWSETMQMYTPLHGPNSSKAMLKPILITCC